MDFFKLELLDIQRNRETIKSRQDCIVSYEHDVFGISKRGTLIPPLETVQNMFSARGVEYHETVELKDNP